MERFTGFDLKEISKLVLAAKVEAERKGDAVEVSKFERLGIKVNKILRSTVG